MIAIKAQPSTSSGLSTSHQYSSADAVNIILNVSPPETQFAADSDSGEEFNARVNSSFNQSDAADINPTGSLSASCTSSFQLRCA